VLVDKKPQCTAAHGATRCERCSRIVMPASRHSTAIARLGEGRAAPEFEAITEFLVDTTRAGPSTGGGRCRADGRREKLGEIRVRPRFAPVYAGRSDGYSPSGRGGLRR